MTERAGWDGVGHVRDVSQVIAGVSGSPGSIAALRFALDVARSYEAALLAVHVWVPPGGLPAYRGQQWPELQHLWEKAARRRLQDALYAAWGTGPPGFEARAMAVVGEPGPVLTCLACSPGDLLVVGAGRRGALARAWGRKVSRYCLAHAECPVLAVPPPALGREAGHGLTGFAFRHRPLTLERALREWEADAPGRRG